METEQAARAALARHVRDDVLAHFDADPRDGGWVFRWRADAPAPGIGMATQWVVLDDGSCVAIRRGRFADDVLAEFVARRSAEPT